MTINGTLFVQAINFFIAYVLLRWLFFKPAIAHIQQEQLVQDDLRNHLIQQEDRIAQKKQSQQNMWQQCHIFFARNIPPIADPDLFVFRDITPPIKAPILESAQLAKLSDQVAQQIVKRINHVV